MSCKINNGVTTRGDSYPGMVERLIIHSGHIEDSVEEGMLDQELSDANHQPSIRVTDYSPGRVCNEIRLTCVDIEA